MAIPIVPAPRVGLAGPVGVGDPQDPMLDLVKAPESRDVFFRGELADAVSRNRVGRCGLGDSLPTGRPVDGAAGRREDDAPNSGVAGEFHERDGSAGIGGEVAQRIDVRPFGIRRPHQMDHRVLTFERCRDRSVIAGVAADPPRVVIARFGDGSTERRDAGSASRQSRADRLADESPAPDNKATQPGHRRGII